MAFAGTKPREDDRDAAADRRVVLETTGFTHEQHTRLAIFLEVRDVRAVQINFGGAPIGCDGDLRKRAVAGGKFYAARKFDAHIKIVVRQEPAALCAYSRCVQWLSVPRDVHCLG